MTTKNASPARSQRKTQRVHNANLKPWPDNPPGYTFLGEVVREVYERLCPPSTELSEQRLFAAIEQIRQDALAGRLALGHFDGDAFAVLGGARLLAGDWRQLFLSCSVESADVFVRDRELDDYVQFIDRVRAANWRSAMLWPEPVKGPPAWRSEPQVNDPPSVRWPCQRVAPISGRVD